LAIHQQVESTSKTTATISLETQLLHLETKMKETMYNVLGITLALEIKQLNLAIAPASPGFAHTIVTSILPLDTAMSPEPTDNLVISCKIINDLHNL
jgi:hypothetical protein